MKKQKLAIGSVFLLILLSLCIGWLFTRTSSLANWEIDFLRQKYPLLHEHDLYSKYSIPLDKAIEPADTVLYAEIVRCFPAEHTHAVYQVKVLSDSKSILSEHSDLFLTIGTDTIADGLESIAPLLHPGERILVPISSSGEYWLMDLYQMYYVSYSGHILSVYEETEPFYTGRHVDSIMREFS